MNQAEKNHAIEELVALSMELSRLSDGLEAAAVRAGELGHFFNDLPVSISKEDMLLALPEFITELVEEKLAALTAPATDQPIDPGKAVIDALTPEPEPPAPEDPEPEPSVRTLPVLVVQTTKDIPSVAFSTEKASGVVQPMQCGPCGKQGKNFETSRGSGMLQHMKHKHKDAISDKRVEADVNGTNSSLGKFMRAKRSELNISATRLAAMTGLMPSTIHRMEQERYSIAPHKKSLKNVAKALQTDVATLQSLVKKDIEAGGIPGKEHHESRHT